MRTYQRKARHGSRAIFCLKKLPPTEELFYQPLTDCPQIEMTDSLIMILPTEKVKNKLQEIEDGKYKQHLVLQMEQ